MRKPALVAIILAVVSAVVAPATATAAEVAVLKSSEVPGWRPALDALRRAAPSHTFTEFDLRGDRAEAERVVSSLKARVALFVAFGPLAAQVVKDVAPETSLIYCMVQDPAKAELLGHANVTGVAASVPVKNQLAAFRTVYPRGVRVGVLYSAENSARLIQEAQKAAAVVRIALVDRPVASEREVPEALRSLLRGDQACDVLWIPADPMLLGDETRRFLLSETLKAGRPVFSSVPGLVQEGALVATGPDLVSVGEQAAEIVGRILAGEKAGRIELVYPRSELVINKKIADKLRIEIPADALKAANRIF